MLLGRGGMGEVYRSAHRVLELPVALKILASSGPAHRQAFERELRAIARIDHPHVMDLLAGGTAETGEWFPPGTRWMAMELARGALADRPPTRWSEAHEVLRAVLSGLGAVHAHGVLHRDLTPGNVLDCGGDGDPWWRLADFGLAAVDGVGLRGGTRGFLSPEVVRGRAEGPASDLYAVGCLAWWLVTGAPPSEGSWAPRFPLPDGLERWVDALLAHDPEDRPTTGRAAASSLPAPGADRVSRGAVAPGRPTAPSATWTDDGEIATGALPPTGRIPPPSAWVDLGGDPHTPRTWGLRALLATDPGLVLLAERDPPLIGRLAERDALWEELLGVCAGGPNRWIRLSGPSGVGTSRLLSWFRIAVAASGSAAAAAGPDGSGPRVWLVDRDEPGPTGPEVAAAAPGLLVVSVGRSGGDRVVQVPPLTAAETSVLLGALGANPTHAPWWYWWTGGRPSQILLRFEAMRRADPAQIHRLERALPVETEAERAFAEAAGAALEDLARRFAALSVEEEVPAGHLLACWRRVPAEVRRPWGPKDDTLRRAVAGELTEVSLALEKVEHVLGLVDQVLPEPWASRARLLARARPDTLADPELRLGRLLVRCFEIASPEEKLAVAEASLAVRTTTKGLLAGIEALFDSGRLEESAAWCRRLPPEARRGLPAVAAARTLRRLGRPDEARAWLDGVDDPDALAWSRLERGELARAEGELDVAAGWYRAVGLSGTRSDVLLNLALIELARGHLAEAESMCLRTQLFPNPAATSAAHLIRARIAARRRDPTGALRAFARVHEAVHNNALGGPDFVEEGLRFAADLEEAGLAAEAAAVRTGVATWPG